MPYFALRSLKVSVCRLTTKGLNRPERVWEVRSLGGVVARSVESIRC